GTDPVGSGGSTGSGYDFGQHAAHGVSSVGGTLAGPASSVHSTIGVSPGWVFLGPLLIAFAAFFIGRLTTVARRPAGDPGGEWIRKLTGPWRAAARIVWIQLRAVAPLAGIAVLIYAEYHILDASGTSGRDKAGFAILALLLLPNMMTGGLLTGFCVTLFAGVSISVFGGQGSEIGLFGNDRPWLIYVLFAIAVLGSALPWLLVRTRRRVVDAAAFAPGGFWRAAVVGAIVGLIIAVLGQFQLTGSIGSSLGLGLGGGLTLGATYSTLAAILAGAIWSTLAYIAVSYQVTPRTAPTATGFPVPAMAAATAGAFTAAPSAAAPVGTAPAEVAGVEAAAVETAAPAEATEVLPDVHLEPPAAEPPSN
ncbi:MAG: hypothetical protein ACRDSS_15930, partial [Actinocrinis sp.]